MKMFLKLLSGRKIVVRAQTDKTQVFAQKLASASKSLRGRKLYIKVDYGDGFINEGVYTEKKELMKAFRAFIEK